MIHPHRPGDLSGTGPPPRYPVRLVDFYDVGSGSEEVWAFACGPALVWCDDHLRYQVRLVDPQFHYINFGPGTGTYDVWAYSSQCCEYPLTLEMLFVEQATFPPYGVSVDLEAVFIGECPNLCGFTIKLKYDSGSRTWKGSGGGLQIEAGLTVVVNPPPQPPTYGMHVVIIDTCVPGTPNIITKDNQVQCEYPLRWESPPLATNCCVCNPPVGPLQLIIAGYCKRFHESRLVDFVKARFKHKTTGTGTGTFGIDTLTQVGTGTLTEVWAYSECCFPFCGNVDCCGVFTNCHFKAAFTAKLACKCLDGDVVTLLPTSPTGGVCGGSSPCWTGNVVDARCLPGGGQIKIELWCQTTGDGRILWTIKGHGTVTGCDASFGPGYYYTRAIMHDPFSPYPDCYPLDLMFRGVTGTITGFSCPGGCPPGSWSLDIDVTL